MSWLTVVAGYEARTLHDDDEHSTDGRCPPRCSKHRHTPYIYVHITLAYTHTRSLVHVVSTKRRNRARLVAAVTVRSSHRRGRKIRSHTPVNL